MTTLPGGLRYYPALQIVFSRKLFRSARIAVRMLMSGQGAELLYLARNRLNGIDLDFVPPEGLGFSAESSCYHSNSGGPACARVFKSLSVPPQSVAVDLGSGKGGAVMTLGALPFAEIIGVEISSELITIATNNVHRAGLRNIRFVQGNAAAFTDFDRVTHIYMYNPFPCSIVVRVMANIAASLASADREITLVYRNPVCDGAVRTSGLFEKVRTIKMDGHECFIYRHLPAALS